MDEQAYINHFENYIFKDRFRESVRRFLQGMTVFDVVDAMNRACARVNGQENAIKYFCGICWKTIKEGGK